MKRDNINYVVVGFFVLLVLVSFFVFLYQIMGSRGPTDKYYVVYNNVSGIKYGTPVAFEGYQVGQVEIIEPMRTDSKTSYRLTLSIEKEWPVPVDSIAKIVASGLLAAVTIDIAEGTSDVLIEPGSEIMGKEAANIFATVSEVATDLRELSQGSIKPLLDNLNKQVDVVSSELTDITRNTVKPMLEKISSQINQTNMVNKVDVLISNLNQTSEDLQKVFNTQNQENLTTFLNNMSNASTGMNELVSNIDDTRRSMDLLLSNIDNVIGDVNYMLEDNDGKMNASLTDLQKTLSVMSTHIDAIAHHLEGSSRNMHEFTRQIKENPGLLIRSSAQTDKAE
jgi:phospholipid/cholesterol/gamma-HCH transport system substrate-binding protein